MVLRPRDESLFRNACSVIAKVGPKICGHDKVPAEPTQSCTHSGTRDTSKVTDLFTWQLLLDFLHLLLDQAVFAFLAGLVWLLPTTFMSAKIVLSPSTSNYAVVVIVLP